MKHDKFYVTFSLFAAGALLTTSAQKEIKRRKFNTEIKGRIRGTQKMLILGDSVARGYGTEIGGIGKSLQEKLTVHFENLQIENLGIDGLTSEGLLKKIKSGDWDEKLKTADVVIINIGGNDLLATFKNEGPKGIIKNFPRIRTQFGRNIREIVKEINSKNKDTILFLNELYDSMDKKNQYFGLSKVMIGYWNRASTMNGIIRVKTKQMSHKKGYWIDMVHPNEEGYEEMSGLVFQQIHKFLL